jgi:hypothetical protein
MAQLNPNTLLPSSSQDALELWDERYNAAQLLAPTASWVSELGEVHTTPALSTKYPMSMLALKFEETIAQEGRFKTIGEKDVELTVVEFDEGVEIELVKVLTNTFSAKRWMDSPAQLLQAEEMFKIKLISDALVANSATCGWDDLTLFNDAHLCNPKDSGSTTFDNLQATTKDCADLSVLEAEISLMMAVPDVNGDILGVMPTHIGVPYQKFQKLRNLLKQDFVPSAASPVAGVTTMRNPYNDGSLTIVCMNQLTDVNDWYMFDMNLISKGVPPWTLSKLALQGGGFDSLSLRRFDENSDHFKKTGKIAVSKHVYYGSKFLFPHAIRKIAGA